MNILNIFNNLVTLGSPHSPTHTLSKQPQCSYKYNVYQHIAPASQGNPPMRAASEESTAGFLPEAPQTGKKGGRTAGAGDRKSGSRDQMPESGRQKRTNGNGQEAPAAGGRHRKSRARTPQSRKRTGITRNWTRKSENGQEKPGNRQGKSDAEEAGIPKVKRIGQGQKKGNPESGLYVRHPQFPHQPKTTNLNEP